MSSLQQLADSEFLQDDADVDIRNSATKCRELPGDRILGEQQTLRQILLQCLAPVSARARNALWRFTELKRGIARCTGTRALRT